VTDDERIARLQRMAYGADTPDPVRARAFAELAALTAAGRDEVRPEPAERDAGAAASGTRGRLIAACAVALAAGVAIGWSLDVLAVRVGSARTVPASETEAWRVFDLPALNGHPARFPEPTVELELDPESRRVLATRWDGVRLIAVRSTDGEDACLILVVPSGPPATACTVDGRFPIGGLVTVTEAPGGEAYAATWDVTGRISLAPAVPAE
jgi:hypothetical protein